MSKKRCALSLPDAMEPEGMVVGSLTALQKPNWTNHFMKHCAILRARKHGALAGFATARNRLRSCGVCQQASKVGKNIIMVLKFPKQFMIILVHAK
jgi:hypothetical protein